MFLCTLATNNRNPSLRTQHLPQACGKHRVLGGKFNKKRARRVHWECSNAAAGSSVLLWTELCSTFVQQTVLGQLDSHLQRGELPHLTPCAHTAWLAAWWQLRLQAWGSSLVAWRSLRLRWAPCTWARGRDVGCFPDPYNSSLSLWLVLRGCSLSSSKSRLLFGVRVGFWAHGGFLPQAHQGFVPFSG